jgi:hypothetical protein
VNRQLLRAWSRIPAIALPIAALAVYFAGLFSIAAVSSRPVHVVWQRLGVSTLPQPFLDLRIIAGVIEQTEHRELGETPSSRRALHTWQGCYLYPGIWLLWRHLGLNLSTVSPWAVTIILGFWAMAVSVALSPKADRGQALYLAALLCSPPCMLAVERANADLVVFMLVAVALLLRSRPWMATGLVALGTIGKIYAVFASPAFGHGASWRRWIPAAAVNLVLLGHAILNFADFVHVWEETPRRAVLSYGAAVPFRVLAARLQWPMASELAHVGGWIAAGAVIVATIWHLRTASRLAASPHDATFLAGAGIYCGTFLIGGNHDYRAIFLLLCVPALWHWRETPDALTRSFARVAVWTMTIFCWWNFPFTELTLAGGLARQMFAWALFAALGGLMFRLLRRDISASWSRP